MAHEHRRTKDKRVTHTGKGKGHSFLMLPHFMLESDQFAALSGSALKLLLEVAVQFRGNNNGDLSIPWSYLEPRGWKSQTTAQRARDELTSAGWLIVTRHGFKKVCSLYAVSWLPIDDVPNIELAKERKPRHTWKNEIIAPQTGEARSTKWRKRSEEGRFISSNERKNGRNGESITPVSGDPYRSSTKRVAPARLPSFKTRSSKKLAISE